MSTGRSSRAVQDSSGTVVARYVADLAAELAALARAQRLDLLAYFLDMAVMEAEQKADGPKTADGQA